MPPSSVLQGHEFDDAGPKRTHQTHVYKGTYIGVVLELIKPQLAKFFPLHGPNKGAKMDRWRRLCAWQGMLGTDSEGMMARRVHAMVLLLPFPAFPARRGSMIAGRASDAHMMRPRFQLPAS
ncbi:hypothetical protein BRADI_3g19185v3 [Brachypodium distachyon]|uniref:Uncharacterized protein n=1 Tax=Brachypodium distachyon TaxID=15368 RepID=A0A0Q3LTQ6_BRADI|nr:hypothetical protein BRADI_3g19185v3 [Brachypodium distachyon]